MLSQVRRSVAGSCASAFQKLLIQSVWRVAMISSYTARTSGLASAYFDHEEIILSQTVARLRARPASENPDRKSLRSGPRLWQTRQDRRLPTVWSQAVAARSRPRRPARSRLSLARA